MVEVVVAWGPSSIHFKFIPSILDDKKKNKSWTNLNLSKALCWAAQQKKDVFPSIFFRLRSNGNIPRVNYFSKFIQKF